MLHITTRQEPLGWGNSELHSATYFVLFYFWCKPKPSHKTKSTRACWGECQCSWNHLLAVQRPHGMQEPVARWLSQASSSLAQPNAKGQHQRGVQGNTACPSLGGLCRGKAVFLGKALLTWVWCPSSASPSCSTPYVLQLVCSTGTSLSAAHPVHEQPEPTVIIGDGLQQQNDSMMRLLFFKH